MGCILDFLKKLSQDNENEDESGNITKIEIKNNDNQSKININKNKKIDSTRTNNEYILKTNQNTPAGLKNLGLTCYMNSILQCLFSINKFRDFFINNIFSEKQPICNSLKEVMINLLQSNEYYISPDNFKKEISKKNKLFAGIKACDAKDLLINIIDGIINELEKDEDDFIIDDGFKIDLSNENEVFSNIKKCIDDNIIINNLFIGYYETINKCQIYNKNLYSFSMDTMMIFYLANFNKNTININELFSDYNKIKEGQFYCNLCKNNNNNSYKKIIYKSPPILIIVLDRGKNKYIKIMQFIIDY